MAEYNAVFCGADTTNIYPICEKVIELVLKSKKCDVFTAVITGDQTSEFADRLTARFADRVKVFPVVVPTDAEITEAAAARQVVLQNVGYLDLVLVQPAAFGCVSLQPGDQYFHNCVLQFLNVTENLLSLLKPKGRFVNLTLPYIVPQFQQCSRKIQKMLLSSKLNRELLYALAHRYSEAIRSKTFEIDQWSSDYVVMAHVFCYAAILMINRDRNLEFDRLSPNCNSGCLIYSVAPSKLPHLKTGLDDTHTKEIADALAGEFTKPDKICGSVLIGQHAVPLNCKLEELAHLLGGVDSAEWSFSLTDHLINPLLYHRSSEFSSLPGQSQFEPYSLCSVSNSSTKKEPARCPCQNCTCDLTIDCGSGGVCTCVSCPCRTCECQACNCTAVVECKSNCNCPACECRTCECASCPCCKYNTCAVECKCKVCDCRISDCATCNCCVKTGSTCSANCVCPKCKCNNTFAPRSIDSRDPEETKFVSTKPEQVICCADPHKCTCKNCCFNQPDGSSRSLKEGCICAGQTNICQTADEKMKNMYVTASVNHSCGNTRLEGTANTEMQTVTTTQTVQVSENYGGQQQANLGVVSTSQQGSQGHRSMSQSSVSQSKSQGVSGDMANLINTSCPNTVSMQAVTCNQASASQSAISLNTTSQNVTSQTSTSQIAYQMPTQEADRVLVTQTSAQGPTVQESYTYKATQVVTGTEPRYEQFNTQPQQLTQQQVSASQMTAPQRIGSQQTYAEQQITKQEFTSQQQRTIQGSQQIESQRVSSQEISSEQIPKQFTAQQIGTQLTTGSVNAPTGIASNPTQQAYTRLIVGQDSGFVNVQTSSVPQNTISSLGINQLTAQVSPANSSSQTDASLISKALSPLAQGPVSSLVLQKGVHTTNAAFHGFSRSFSGSPLNSREIGGFTTLQTSKSQGVQQPTYYQAQQTTMTTKTQVPATTVPQQTPQIVQHSSSNLQHSSSLQLKNQTSSANVPQMTTNQPAPVNVEYSVPEPTYQTAEGETRIAGSYSENVYQSQVSGSYKETSRVYTQTASTINQVGENNQPSTGVTVSQPAYQQAYVTTTTTQQIKGALTDSKPSELRSVSNATCLTISNKSQNTCSLADFVAIPVPRITELPENELSVRLEYLATNYWLVARAQVGDQVRSRGLARVLQSRNPNWAVGDVLCDDFPWADGEFCHSPSACARKYNPNYPPDVYLSAYSDDAISAQMLLKACNAEFGKTLVVNDCVSPIAYLTCLYAKRVLNMAVIAVASSPQACQILKEQIGANICINTMNCVAGVDLNTQEGQKVAYTKYLNELRAALAQLGTSHIDCVIENHGGYQLDAHLALLNEHTHIAFCGLASSLNDQVSSDPHEQYAYKNLNSLFKTSSSIRGYKATCSDSSRDAACAQHVAEVVKTFYDQTDRMMVQPDLRIPQVPRVECASVLSDAVKVLVHVVNSPTPAKSCVLKLPY